VKGKLLVGSGVALFYARCFFQELRSVFVHLVNLISNLLGEDLLSRRLRATLLRSLGVKLGPRTHVFGGCYFPGGDLKTGARCRISHGCYFDFTDRISFGDRVVVGHGVTFVTAEHQIGGSVQRAGAVRGRPIIIGDGVWIGANATLLPGVTVGKGAIVAAGTVVTKDVPSDVVVAGIPARVIKNLAASPETGEMRR
jgi:acetyltransferase-like isoleucine patch superfamily enzyme